MAQYRTESQFRRRKKVWGVRRKRQPEKKRKLGKRKKLGQLLLKKNKISLSEDSPVKRNKWDFLSSLRVLESVRAYVLGCVSASL